MPPETEAEIGAAAVARSRRSARSPACGTISGDVYKKPFTTTGPAVGWVGETRCAAADRVADARRAELPDDGALRHAGGDRALLEDAAVNIDQWIADEVEQVFAEQEGTAFVTGDGINKPKGFLAYTKVAEAPGPGARSATCATGVAGGFAARATRPMC